MKGRGDLDGECSRDEAGLRSEGLFLPSHWKADPGFVKADAAKLRKRILSRGKSLRLQRALAEAISSVISTLLPRDAGFILLQPLMPHHPHRNGVPLAPPSSQKDTNVG